MIRRLAAAGLGLWLGAFTLQVHAEDCRIFAGLAARPVTSDPFEFNASSAHQITVEEAVSTQAAEEFLSGQVQLGQLFQCVAGYQERNRFLLNFQSTLIQSSLARLRHARSARIREFVRRVDASSLNGSELTIRLTGHGLDTRPVDKKAGYHRTNQSIFMDLDSIAANEWLIILIHELSHYLDDRVYQSVKAFLNKDTVAIIAATSARTSVLAELSPEEKQTLDQWLGAGLDSGLLAEYRAWGVTVLLYNDGLVEGLWPSVGWMEEFRAQIGEPLHPWPKLMEYLDRRGLNPHHSLFAWPLVQTGLKQKREELVQRPPAFLQFESLF